MSTERRGYRHLLLCMCIAVGCSAWCRWARALPPDPNNAALLYYQAFLMRPELDDATEAILGNVSLEDLGDCLRTGEFRPLAEKEARLQQYATGLQSQGVSLDDEDGLERTREKLSDFIDSVRLGQAISIDEATTLAFEVSDYLELRKTVENLQSNDPREVLRNYLEKARPTIDLVEAATELPRCDWGYQHSKGVGGVTPIHLEAKPVLTILVANALTLAVEGDTRAAFERTLQLRQFATHIGRDSGIGYFLALAIEGKAIGSIEYLLRHYETDTNTLVWLRHELALQEPSALSASRPMGIDFEQAMQTIRIRDELLGNAVKLASIATATDPNKRTPTGEALLAEAAQPFLEYVNAMVAIIDDTELTYEEKEAKAEQINWSFRREYVTPPDDMASLLDPMQLLRVSLVVLTPDLSDRYEIPMRYRASYNRLLAAIDVMLAHHQSGQWPETLPAGVPKDPITGEDFGYERTEDGFILTLDKDNVTSYLKRQFIFP